MVQVWNWDGQDWEPISRSRRKQLYILFTCTYKEAILEVGLEVGLYD